MKNYLKKGYQKLEKVVSIDFVTHILYMKERGNSYTLKSGIGFDKQYLKALNWIC